LNSAASAKFGFIKLMNHKLSIILSLAGEKKVTGRDILVLIACVHFTDWKTGRSRVTTKKISELLGTAQPNVRGSLRKLKAYGLIADVEDRDGTLYMIPHPKIFECSSGKARGLLLKNYYEGVYGKNKAASIEDEEMEWLNAKDSTTDIASSPAGDDLEDSGWADKL